MIALVLSLALAAPGEAEPPKVGAEVQDLLLLHEEGPLRLRVKISNGDKSVFGRWHEHIDRWFKFADRDNSGHVDPNELDRVPSIVQMQQMMQSGQFYGQQRLGALPGGVAGQGAVTLKELDLDNDGKIDKHEFVTFYAANPAVGPLQVVPGYSQYAYTVGGGSAISDALYRALDANKDGRLSRAELARAPVALSRFDLNDDEIVSSQEILGGNQYAYQYQQQTQAGLGLLPLPREANDLRVTARHKFAKDLLLRLDADKSGGLSNKEFRVSAAEFAKLDASKDGALDALELVKWLLGPADLEVNVRMETLIGADAAVEVKGANVVVSDKPTANGIGFRVGDALIQIDRNANALNRVGGNAGANMKQYFVQIFGVLDPQKMGKVALEEINKNPQGAYLRQMGPWLDLDGDGFVTVKELDGFVELTSGGVQSQLSIGFMDQGRGLFEILDTQADSQLSVAELKAATKVFTTYLKPGADVLERTDIPRRYQMVVSQNSTGGGQMMLLPGQGGVRVRPQPGVLQNPGKGPAWFQKMDVNADGHVSPREFLGPMTLFKAMDADGNDLIAHEEATRYDGEQRAKKPQRETIREAPVEHK